MKPKPIGIAPQPPSSKSPPVVGTTAAPPVAKTVAFTGAVLGACVMVELVKLPAVKPELMVALVPGQTPVAVVVTVAFGNA